MLSTKDLHLHAFIILQESERFAEHDFSLPSYIEFLHM